MAAPDKIIELVERFDRNIDAYKSGHYNETQVRHEFIDPFFIALGWDVNNEEGYAEAYKDVIHEDSIKVEKIPKAPDYCFRIGGMRKFFLEAKKPSVNIKEDIHPAYQLRRYAWSAKLPLSILTDFEEFTFYDCRIKPVKTDKSTAARIKYFTYKDYPEYWDYIVSIFSHEAILKGSFDKFIESTKTKRGTAEVDKAFLTEIESWRENLARNIAIRNPSLTRRELNFAVQRTIDRIIFLRICEDRAIEDYGTLMGLLNGSDTYKRLKVLYHSADDKYNSGLFHFRAEKGFTEPPDELTPGLAIDDKQLKDIIKSLYYPESPYEFSVLPADILGQVYEQFLGKVIRLTPAHRAVVEDKPEVKKAGGVYYTPTYIVDYIVKNTVGQLLDGKTPVKVSKLKILDPACGSGSFLIGAYQCLLDWHREWYENNDPEKWAKSRKPRLYKSSGGDWRLTTDERKRILLNNIYGVDIDPDAVEVTKLSLLLKVLEGENEQTLARQYKLFHERALPNLSGNIKCGNSLIGPDFYDGRQLDLFDEEERYRINVFDWDAEFPEIIKAGGFDAVIGNPPYVRQESLGEFKQYFQVHYQVYHSIADLYAYFIEKGISILNHNGIFSYIVANKWLRVNYGKQLRSWLKEKCIEEIIDFGDLPVFQKATTYPCILRISNKKPNKTFKVTNVKSLDFGDLNEYVRDNHFIINLLSMDESFWSLADEKSKNLLKKIRLIGIPLEEYVKGKIYRGILTGHNEAFVIGEKTKNQLINEDPKNKDIIKKFLLGRDIKRFHPLNTDKYLIFTRRGIEIKNYPVIERYLSSYKNRLMPKPEDFKGDKWKGRKTGSYKWFEIQDTINYHKEFEKPKIIYPNICKKPEFTFDQSGLYTNQKCFIISINDKYLLGLLNSALMVFLFKSILPKLRGDFFEPSYVYFKSFPIRTINFSDPADKSRHDRMVELVESMLTLHKQSAEAKTAHDKEVIQRQIGTTDRQIDKIVYELYDLTEEEIRIAEEST
ncbi:MAG: N-6 DNA methylase [Candidatus Latescibacteria bacterium]|jgi:type I restriction-modification system DNA methylase subunit|nr:N-6 DNA methylase [Candidatus Latescibacterota bacterium]